MSHPERPDEPKGDVDGNLYVAKSFRLGAISYLQVVWSLYGPKVPALTLVAIIAFAATQLGEQEWVGVQIVAQHLMDSLGWPGLALLALLAGSLYLRGDHEVYLIDFEVATLPEEWMVSHEQIIDHLRAIGCFSEEALDFQRRLIANSGTSQRTPWAATSFRKVMETGQLELTKAHALEELEYTVIQPLRRLMERTRTKPKSVDFLVVNCSLFSPTPSICAVVSQKLGLRSDVRTYNLAGMGCSAGLISIDLAKQVLAANPNSTCLVVSTENISQQMYTGSERSMLLSNTLFRAGGAAVLLSNKRRDRGRAHFKLLHCVRTQNMGDDAHACVYQDDDAQGHVGVRLSKQVVAVAGKALQANLTMLGPLVLPLREQIKSAGSMAWRAAYKWLERTGRNEKLGLKNVDFYVPNFKRGIDHFCVHAGGRAVLDGIEKNLRLTHEDMEPSRLALYNHGNTSSSSIWYEMHYVRESGRLRSGHRVLQVGFGSGFKCNSAVWLCLRP